MHCRRSRPSPCRRASRGFAGTRSPVRCCWHDEVGEPRYGQIRLSLYDDNGWRTRVARLAEAYARFEIVSR